MKINYVESQTTTSGENYGSDPANKSRCCSLFNQLGLCHASFVKIVGVTTMFVTCSHPAQSNDSTSFSQPLALKTNFQETGAPRPRALLRQTLNLFDAGGSRRDAYQCKGFDVRATLGDWTGPVYINADNGWGGCAHSIGILDTYGELKGLRLTVEFYPSVGADAGQCQGQRDFIVEHSVDLNNWQLPAPMIINTDDRPGYCIQTYRISGRNDVELDISFYPTDIGVDQCLNRTTAQNYHTVTASQPVSIGIHTDSRYGGCNLNLRLRKTS